MSSDEPTLRRSLERNRTLPLLFLLLALIYGALPRQATAQVPVITLQPVGSTNLTATEVTFLVEATGTPPLRYQWYFNITNRLAGETNPSITYTNIGEFQEGFFSVVITNTFGAVTSTPAFLFVQVPPLVTREPTNVTVAVGGTAQFSVTASGDPPLRYQWFFNIIDEIVGATNATLTLTNLQKSDSGSYQIEVSNDYDTVNSVEAFLTVKDPPVITSQPASLSVAAGTGASFSVNVTGDGPFAFQWYFNQTNVIFGATSSSLNLANAQLLNAGTYHVVITTDVGVVTSTPANLIVLQAPSITIQPLSTTTILNSNASFSVSANGTSPLTYQWFFNRTNPIAGATQSTLSIPSAQQANAGIYSVVIANQSGSVTSINASLTVLIFPQIATAPSSLSLRAGQTAVFSVTATGTAPLIYRWFFNSTNLLAGANSSSLTLPNVQLTNAGTYTVVISNLAGVVASAPVNLAVQSPPVIVQQPASRAVLPGSNATFTVQAIGDAPLAYQWFFNGSTPISGATASELVINNAQTANNGSYSVRITNSLGVTFSSTVTLAVKLPPIITQQPVSLTVTQGNAASFAVSVSGDGPFHYRWLRNGTNAIPGTNAPVLQIANAQGTNAGAYVVIVTNEVGSATSTEAQLTVRTAPIILTQPADLFAAPGDNAAFTVVANGDQPLFYQWCFNGTNVISAATNASLTIQNISVNSDGLYSVVITNEIGTISSQNAALKVRQPPLVTVPPASLTVTQGHSATFSVAATGDGPFSYQWLFNGNSISGATGSTLTLNNVLPSAAGQYSVRITNVVRSITSPAATLTVRPLPVIAQQPSSLVSTQGQTATFTVTATSETPVNYQWRQNGISLAGNNAFLSIANVLPSNAGIYDVIVANSYGSVTSAIASLTVYGIDFGDAPAGNYPTLLANSGARHVIVTGVHLGATIDFESNGQPSTTASGDDQNGSDDEDGIRFTTALHVGEPATVEVVASTNGFLNAWIDYDRATGWLQDNEHVMTNVAVQPGTNLLQFVVPANAAVGSTLARFRFSTAQNVSFDGFAADGEVEDYSVTILPAANIVVNQSYNTSVLPAGNAVALTINATNLGPSAATAVVIANELSRRSAFISAASTKGSCSHDSGVVLCEIGSLAVGEGVQITINSTPGAGANSSTTIVEASEFDPTPVNASIAVVGTSVSALYANSDIIIMPFPDAGAATPYPSPVLVSGVTAAVHQVIVTLRSLNHDYPDDIDILLVGPQGQAAILMSDAGLDSPVVDATITFDDELGQLLPDAGPITSGTYAPFNHLPLNEVFPAPAPVDVQTADLSQFRGTDPNGVWSLYIVDDAVDNNGSEVPGFIADGWTLSFVTADPLADLTLGAGASPAVASIGQPITYTISVTNHGPTVSSAICQATLPPALNFVSASTPQGSCSHAANAVSCDLGNILPGAIVTFNVTVSASIGGNVATTFSVSGTQLDLNAANNTTTATHFVQPLVNLAVTQTPPAAPVLLNQTSSGTLVITNHGPNSAAGVWLTNRLPNNATYQSSTTSQGSCSAAGQSVICNLGEVPVGTAPSITIRFIPGISGAQSNTAHVVAAEEDSNSLNNLQSSTFVVSPATDLFLASSASGTTVPVTQDYVVTLDLTNRGPLAVNATLTDVLPSTTTFVSAFTTRGACTNQSGEVICQFDNLIPNESARVILRARANTLGPITNIASAAGTLPDNNTANNAVTNLSQVVPNANLAIGMADRPNPVWLGDNLVYAIAITNLGPSAATNVVVTNQLPAGVNFISAATSQGSCTRSGDTIRCDLGTMTANAQANIAVTIRPTLTGLISSSASVGSPVSEGDTSNNIISRTTRVITGNVDLANSTPVTTPLLGLANPYPSSITVSGVSSAIHRIRVSLLNLSHSFSDDLDILLVGPDGRATLLMSDCGGEFTINGATLTFDDSATNALSDFNLISSGTVRPSNFGAETDSFAAPAPAGPYSTNLSIFNGTDPNGTWSLYIMDDADKDSGTLAGGWRLSISAFEPMADLGLAQTVSQPLAAAGSNVVFTYTVTNRGPSVANSVQIASPLPDALNIVGFTNLNGNCAVEEGILNCDLGTITPAGAASLTIVATSLVPGTITNSASVSFAGVDLRLTNNVASTIITFELPPFITLQPVTQTASVGSSVQFIATAIGAEPLSYRWQKDGVDVPSATSATLSLANITLADAGSYRLRVSNSVGSVLSDPAQLLIPGPPTISTFANLTIDEDIESGPIAFSVQDFDTPLASLSLTGLSSNPALVSASGFTFAGLGQNRTVRIRPNANQSGTAVLSIVVQDTTGASATNSFTLTVRPVIDSIIVVQQPRNVLAVTGAPVTLSITATSSLPITYQWQRNGQSLPGATSPTLQFASVQGTNAGSYTVLMSNGETNLSSVAVNLSLTNALPRPQIVSITQNGTTATVTVTTVVGLNYTLEYKVNLSNPDWTPLGTIPGTGSQEILTDSTATIPALFYRVRAE